MEACVLATDCERERSEGEGEAQGRVRNTATMTRESGKVHDMAGACAPKSATSTARERRSKPGVNSH